MIREVVGAPGASHRGLGVVDPQYRQLVTSPSGGAVLRIRSTILGAYIW